MGVERSPCRLGVIANEFFDTRISRIGGFAMLSRQVARWADAMSDLNFQVHLFHGNPSKGTLASLTQVYGRPLHASLRNWRVHALQLLLSGARPDVWLSIDYRCLCFR